MLVRARSLPLAVCLAALALPLAGCQVLQRIAGNAPADLTRATIRRMTVSLRKQEQTVCPREQVQMGVFITAVPDGAKEEKTFETWVGRGAVNKNDKLDFTDFTFQSEQGQFDKDGWMAPLENLTATAGHEFIVHATYNPSSAIFSYTYKWKPDYACITSASKAGDVGALGGPGKDAANGKMGDGGGVMSAGGDGQDGAPGGTGLEGANGAPGPKIRAVATYVKTPYYEKLIGIRLSGAITDFLLVEPGHPFTIHANGGVGGAGGPGGRGGAGGAGAAGNPGGHGGNGGAGGIGGRGGNGGAGGAIELVFDARYPEVASALVVDASGAAGGVGGHGGTAGEGGIGGKGISPANNPAQAPDGAKGHAGNDGTVGAAGHAGANGTAVVHAGPIGDSFAGLTDITVLNSVAPPRTAR